MAYEKPRLDSPENNIPGKQWFVLPGLKDVVDRYIYMLHKYFKLSIHDAAYDKPIMIVGDSGVGKSLFIQIAKELFIADKAFNKDKIIRLNCATLDSTFAVSEIFGHEKGSFTGAISAKKGIVEDYENGLLILDEIGELTQDVQAKLLLFIEDNEYKRLGSNKTSKSYLKILGTTNKSEKDFRSDFWYRFNMIFVPPLFERRDDVLYYIMATRPDIFKMITPALTTCLLAHNWPGNTREIQRILNSIDYEFYVNQKSKSNVHPSRILLYNEDKRYSSLSLSIAYNLGSKLLNANFDVLQLNDYLHKYGIMLPFFFNEIPDKYFDKINTLTAILNSEKDELNNCPASNLSSIKKSESSLYSNIYSKLQLEDESSDSNHIVKMMIKHEFNLMHRNHVHYFKQTDFDTSKELYSDFKSIFNIKLESKICDCYSAFKSLCNLLHINHNANNNVFISNDANIHSDNTSSKTENLLYNQFKKSNLVHSAKLYFLNLGENSKPISKDNEPLHPSHINSNILHQNDHFHINSELNNTNAKDILFAKNSEEQLLISFYNWIIQNSKNLKEAAQKSGLNYNTFRSKLRKYKIKTNKS